MSDLKILLSILLNKAAQKEVLNGLDQLESEMHYMGATAEDVDDSIRLGLERALENLEAQTRKTVTALRELAMQGQKISMVGRGVALAGTALVGGIYALAATEANRMREAGDEADALTQRWFNANDRIARSTQRIGRVAMSEVLPFLERAATIAEKIATFIERNPDVIKAALVVGGAMAIMGTLTSLIGSGISTYAKIAELLVKVKAALAAEAMKATVSSQLSSGAGAAAGGGTAGLLGAIASSALWIALGVTISKVIVDAVSSALAKTDFGKKIDEAQKGAAEGGRGYPGINVYSRAVKDAERSSRDAADAVKGVSSALDGLEGSANAAEASQILQGLQQENLQAEKNYNQQRQNILQQATASLHAAARQLGHATTAIKRNLEITLAGLASDYAATNLSAEREYQARRAEIIAQGNENIARIHADAQEELRKLEEDHAERVDELARDRDALGLVKEQRDYNKRKAEIRRNEKEQIAEARRQTQIQLAEAQRSFVQQQQQRREQYLQQVEEARLQAEQQLQETRAQYAIQTAEIARQRKEQLAQLQRSYEQERQQRIQAAQSQLRDLGYFLSNDQLVRKRGYDVILQDAEAFMADYRRSLDIGGGSSSKKSSKSSSGMYQHGGYTREGPAYLHDQEFIANARTTRMLEQLVGGRLTQERVIAVASRGGGRGAVTWNDQRRFYGGVTPKERREITNDTLEVLAGAL